MREDLSKTSLQYRRILHKYPNAKKIEVNYVEGGYLNKSYTEYLVDGKVIPELTEIGSFQ